MTEEELQLLHIISDIANDMNTRKDEAHYHKVDGLTGVYTVEYQGRWYGVIFNEDYGGMYGGDASQDYIIGPFDSEENVLEEARKQ